MTPSLRYMGLANRVSIAEMQKGYRASFDVSHEPSYLLEKSEMKIHLVSPFDGLPELSQEDEG